MIGKWLRRLRSTVTWLWRRPWRRILRPALYVLPGMVLALWFTFPLETKVRQLLGYAAATGQVDVQFERLRRGFFGVHLEDVDVGGKMSLVADELSLGLAASTLWLQPAAHVVLRAGEGAARFVYGLGWHDYIGIEATALDLSASKLGDALPLGLSLRGRLSGAGEFDGIGGSAQAITGEVELEIADARLNTAGLPIPVTSVDLGKIVGSVHAQAGELLLQPIQVDGTDLYGTVRGPIRIRKPFQQSLAELRVRVRFTSDELEGALGSLMPMAGFRQQQEFWERTVRGPLVSLR